MRTIALTAALLTTLTACTAMQRGDQENYPVELTSPYAAAPVLPGKTAFVQVTYPRTAFEDGSELDRYYDQVTFDYSTVRSDGDKVPDPYIGASWIKLDSVDAPKGLSVVLVKSEIGRAVIKTRIVGGSVDVQYYDKVRLTYKVSVAADFTPTQKKVTSSSSTLSKYLPSLSDVLPLDAETAQLKFSVNGAVQSAALAVRTTPEKSSK